MFLSLGAENLEVKSETNTEMNMIRDEVVTVALLPKSDRKKKMNTARVDSWDILNYAIDQCTIQTGGTWSLCS